MAQYTSVSYIEELFGGRFAFGTSGTCIASVGMGTRAIENVSNWIDFELQALYGTATPLFGTNLWGTIDTPNIINDIACDLAVGMVFDNVKLSVTTTQYEWSRQIFQRGWDRLTALKNGEAFALPFAGTLGVGNLPSVSNNYGFVYGEMLTLAGTNPVALDYNSIVKQGVRVYGTNFDNGTVLYHEGTNYKLHYYDTDCVGTNYGYIWGVGSGTLAVRIDYMYLKDRVFALNDFKKWGEGEEEDRG